MTPRRIAIFFYGLFMDPALLRAQGIMPAGAEQALLRGMALRIGQRATLVPEERAVVYGMLMRLTHAEIDRLYGEDSVSSYRPEAVEVELRDGALCAALCFNLVVPPAVGELNPGYAAKLRLLGERLCFPASYLAQIR